MWHPWSRLEPSTLLRAFGVTSVVSVVLAVTLGTLDRSLQATGNGVLCLEFAGDLNTAQAILAKWGESGRTQAAFQIGLDYLFLVAYSLALSLGCVMASRWCQQASKRLAAVGVALAWGAFVAGLLDAVENFAMMWGLFGAEGSWWPVVAMWCAIPKFVLVGLAAVYFVVGLGFWLRYKDSRPKE